MGQDEVSGKSSGLFKKQRERRMNKMRRPVLSKRFPSDARHLAAFEKSVNQRWHAFDSKLLPYARADAAALLTLSERV